MDSPLNHRTNQNQVNLPDCLDVSPERLNSMSPSELEQAMEAALSAMTEENYDPAVIDAYLDVLDRKTTMPAMPDAKTSYADFQRRIYSLSEHSEETAAPKHKPHSMRFRNVLRVGLAAALMVACLFGTMVVVQASGVDVFGALARWTESAFSFGPIQSEQNVEEVPTTTQRVNNPSDSSELPSEYQELGTMLKVQGIDSFMFPTYIPSGFYVEGSDLYVQSKFNTLDFMIQYVNGYDDIMFNILYGTESNRIYEKDEQNVEVYGSKNIEYYIFSNCDRNIATWHTGNIEYSIKTSLAISELKEILDSMSEE